ncbi:O-antigen ligase family protein [Pseudalkalibacillus sp. Hm43]|uniref:O-antigen ligase family protein n=1 Tax=Pseudalkalibacillus sp. Hm43 TaxID=3450742 RepID=UPI003F42CD4D
MMMSLSVFAKKHFMTISIILCFLLPPLGVTLMLLIGCYSLNKAWKNRLKVNLTPGLFLLCCMFISSLGAGVVMKDHSYFLVSALMLAYIGLYIKITKECVMKTFSVYKWITIYGCLYFYGLYPFQEVTIHPTIKNYLAGTALLGVGDVNHYPRLIGAAYNPNFSVTILLLGLAFLLAELLKNLRNAAYVKVGFQSIAIIAIIHAIILTGSRAGFATMSIIFVLFCFRWNKVVTLLFTLMLAVQYKFILEWMPRNENLFESAETRKDIWKKSFDLWQEYPLFGMTPLGFREEYVYMFHEEIPHAHNLFLAMFAEYGALGGVALIVVVLINIYKASSLFLIKYQSLNLDTFLLSLPVIFLTGIFDYVIFSPQVAVMAILLMASWDKYTARIPLWDLQFFSIPYERYRYYL